jgi:serine phosphatase RsbU (regulator of sigma subunit)
VGSEQATEQSTERRQRRLRFVRPQSLGELDRLSRLAMAAIGLAVVIAVLDAVIGGPVILGLLALPPILAALGTSQAETVLISILCVLAALVGGVWDDKFASADHISLLLTVVAGAAVGAALARARGRVEADRKTAQLFAESGYLLEDTLARERAVEHIAELAVPAIADVAAIDVLEEDGSISRLATAAASAELREVTARLREQQPIDITGSHPISEAIRIGQIRHISRPTEARLREYARGEEELQLMLRFRAHSALILPLRARGAILGAMSLSALDPRLEYDQETRRVAEALAARAALALDNARLHEQQTHIAGVLQQSLLPRSLPEINGFETGARFLAAGEAVAVGGDFYDVFHAGSNAWMAVIGDVCGKGPEAAAVTALARYTIRTAATQDGQPSSVLAKLHTTIRADRSDLRFCTAALARIEQGNGRHDARLTVALGGHHPPLALRRSGTVERIGEPGTLLGGLAQPVLSDVEASLAAGESLVLFTDGLLELRDRSGPQDPTWVDDLLVGVAGASADQIAEHLARAAFERQGGELRDDVAVLVLRRTEGRSGDPQGIALRG